MTTFKNILVALLFFVSCNVLLAQNGYLKPTFPSEEANYNSGFITGGKPFVEVIALNSFSFGAGYRIFNSIIVPFEVSAHYDFLKRGVFAKVGLYKPFKIKRRFGYLLIGAHCAYSRSVEGSNSSFFIPAHVGLAKGKYSFCYVRNFFLNNENALTLPVHQIAVKYVFIKRKRSRHLSTSSF